MKKLFISLQILACCGLAAQQTNKPTKSSVPYFERGDEFLAASPMASMQPAAYNYPANVKVKDGWDVYADVSYLYWFTGEDSMDLARTVVSFGVGDVFYPSNDNGFVVTQNFNYTSGFKAGLGWNLDVDDWVVDLEYTYMRQTTHTSSGSASPGLDDLAVGVPAFAFDNWYSDNYFGMTVLGTSFTSKWKFGLDWADLTFKRPFYQGTRLSIIPSAGLRASWIRQTLNIYGSNVIYGYNQAFVGGSDTSKNSSNSWGIGPRGVVEGRWLLGAGFRFQGNFGGSLLFTQYTHVSHSETGNSLADLDPVDYSMKNYNCLRPMAEGNLGIGWGGYSSCKGYHFDLSATYDFNYLWSQNMMKYLVDVVGVPGSGTADNLYLHGLTVKARFDF